MKRKKNFRVSGSVPKSYNMVHSRFRGKARQPVVGSAPHCHSFPRADQSYGVEKGTFARLTARGNSRDDLKVNEGEKRDKRNRDENVEGARRRLAGVHVEPVND